MKILFKSFVAASVAATALATPAAAQVQGKIATVDPASVVLGTNAFKTAYQQIGTTYKGQIDGIRQREQERQTLLKALDKNSDNQIDDAELEAAQKANTPGFQRIGQIEQEVAQMTNQVEGARVYAIEQILRQYGPTLQEIAQQQQIQLVLAPETVVYAPPAINITTQVVNSLNTKVPSVQIVPPQDWQPNRNAVAIFQQIQQVIV
ncbi:MAG: OmpH family outer membrane protein, partial [Alphaproteobacteria bacterium]